MTSMFWGLKLEPGKRYSTTVDKSFHISMATLDASSVSNEKEVVSVALEEGGQGTMFLLTNLRIKDALSSSLDLNFMTGDRITLFCKGQGVVHLSGYMVLDDDDELSGTMMDDEAEEEEEVDDEEVDDEAEDTFLGKAMKALQNAKAKAPPATAPNQKRKLETELNSKTKKKKIDLPPAGKEADSEEESADGDTDDLLADEEDSEGDEEEDEVGDDDEDDEEEEEEEVQMKPPKKPSKQQQQQKNKSPGREQQQQQGRKQQQQKPATPKTPNGVASPPAGQKLNQSGKKEEKKKSANFSPVKETEKQKGAETSLTGGVKVKDLRVGSGPLCKNGKLAVVYYTGRLKSNGKVFDSVMQGSGFKFKVGLGEVIKGWDIGVAGMKVGGKRIITCPPQAAYGGKGAPPQVPPNSTLVFEVELKAVN